MGKRQMQNSECSFVQGKYTDFIDETLNDAELKLVTNHLLTCEKCKALFSDLDSILNQLHNLPRLSVSPEFSTKLMTEIKTSATDSAWHRFYHSSVVRLGSYAVAAGLVLALGVTYWMVPVGTGSNLSTEFANKSSDIDPSELAYGQTADSNEVIDVDSLYMNDPVIQHSPTQLQLVNDAR